jgi:ABC-type Zn2+ transport system substrate-binding protein/surface adhesin
LERPLLTGVKLAVYDPFLSDEIRAWSDEPRVEPHVPPVAVLQRQRSRLGTLPTAHPDFNEGEEEEEGGEGLRWDRELEGVVRHHHLHGGVAEEGHHPHHHHAPHAHAHVSIQPRRTRVTALATSPEPSER